MKFNTALTTLVSLSTVVHALPNSYNFKRQFNGNGTFGNATSSSSALNGGAGVGAQNTALTTQTVIETQTTVVSQQYTTFTETNLFTATIVVPGGGAAVAPVATIVSGQSTPGSSGSGSVPAAVVGSGTSAPGSSGSDGTSGVSGGSVAGTSGGSGTVAGTSEGSDSACVCSVPAVVATAIYTVAVNNVIDLGSTTITSNYPTTTLGVVTVQGGSIVPAVATVTQTAVVATNTNAPLAPGQSYQTVTLPGVNGAPSTTVVLIVTVINNIVVPVTNNGGSGVGAQPNNGGAGVGAGSLSTAPFTNSSATATGLGASSTLGGGAGVGAQQLTLTSSGLASATSPVAAVGAPVEAGTSNSATPATSTITPGAAVAAAATPTTTGGTNAVAVGSLGTTPLYNQQAFIDDILNYHNTLRARNGAPALTWNADLAQVALNNVNANAADGTFLHTTDMGISNPYGENIATQYGYNNPEYLVYLWYEENTSYSSTNPVFMESTGHYTQLVWASSTELGCAYTQANDANGDYYLACEYSPPGNYAGEFTANVYPMTATGQPAQPAMYI